MKRAARSSADVDAGTDTVGCLAALSCAPKTTEPRVGGRRGARNFRTASRYSTTITMVSLRLPSTQKSLPVSTIDQYF